MLRHLIAWSAHNRLLVYAFGLLLVALGAWATWHTTVDALPDLSDVQVIIETPYPGQSPELIDQQVTYPLASAMLALPRVRDVRGYSMPGVSFVYVIFEDGTDLYWARSRLLERLGYARSQLPAGLEPQLGPDATGVGWIFQYSLIDRTARRSLAELRAIQDWFLRYELQAIAGVAEVATVGGFVRQYQVLLDPQRMAAYGVTPQDVVEALRASNQDVDGGMLEFGGREQIIRARGYLRTLEEIRNLPVRPQAMQGSSSAMGGALLQMPFSQEAGADASPTVRLAEVAVVQLGPAPRRGIAERNGEGEVVSGIVVMRHGENALRVIERVKAKLEALRPSLPEGLEIAIDYDRSRLIREVIATLREKLLLEMLLVALVTMLFLAHLPSALPALITIPTGVLAALLLMWLLRIDANVMSLGGIAIAIGVMVDAATVMVENAHKHLERLQARWGAEEIPPAERAKTVLKAAQEVGPSLFFTLLIVTVSFLPVFALSEMEGRLFRPLALTKTFAMAAASVLTVVLVPPLMLTFVRGRILPESRHPLSQLLMRGYRPLLRFALRRPRLVVFLGAAVLLVSLLPMQTLLFGRLWVPFPQIGSEFMPPLYEGDLLYMPTTPPGLSVTEASRLLQLTNRIIKSFPEVEAVLGKAGRAETATDPAPMEMFETIVRLKPRSAWRPGVDPDSLIRALDEAVRFPGLTNAWTMPIRARIDMLSTGMRTPVGVKLYGPDLKMLEELARRLEAVLRAAPGVRSVYAERMLQGSYLEVELDREAALRYGLSSGDVQQALMTLVAGQEVSQWVSGLERYPLVVRLSRDFRQNPEALARVPIPIPSGGTVPLQQVARLRWVSGPSMIRSENARPSLWVYVDLQPGQDVGSFVRRAQRLLREHVSLPAGYTLRWSGQFEHLERAHRRLRLLIPLTLASIFLLLLLNFRSAAEALLLMIPLPFAVVGSVWWMWLAGYNMSVAVAVGWIAVAGLAAQTAVVMHVYLDEAIRRYRDQGRLLDRRALVQALEEGAVERLRPKMMTVLTTLVGLLPILFGSEPGSEVMKRIAAPMVGGLITSALHTLVMIPALYVLVHGRRLPGSAQEEHGGPS